jgi:tetratricopeptide (TPR) repeat protein
MATRPEDRYASCRALAEDIERWLADESVSAYPEPWTRTLIRWLTRHRTGETSMAAALLVGLVGLGAVAAVQTKARADFALKNRELTIANSALDRQRRRAEANEAEAIAAVKKFRDAVTENPELKNNPALERLRKTLLKQPLAFFRSLRQRLQADRDTRPRALAELAEVIHAYAHLTDKIGDTKDSLKAHEDSLAIWLGLTRDDPDNAEYQDRLGTILKCQGNFLSTTGRQSEALAVIEQARAIFERLVWDNPTVTDFQSHLAKSHDDTGVLLRATGKPSEALTAYEQARAIFERLARDNPSDTGFQTDLATSH